MDPTSLPTDNLYKFMALSGMGIVGFAVWFRWKRLQSFADGLSKARIENSGLMTELEQIHESLSIQSELAEDLRRTIEEEGKSDDVDEAWRQRRNNDITRVETRLEDHEARLSAVAAALGRSSETTKSILAHQEQFQWLHGATLGLALVGVALSCCGFTLWYFKLQWYQDRQTDVQTKTVEQQLEIAKLQRQRAQIEIEQIARPQLAAPPPALAASPSAPSSGAPVVPASARK